MKQPFGPRWRDEERPEPSRSTGSRHVVGSGAHFGSYERPEIMAKDEGTISTKNRQLFPCPLVSRATISLSPRFPVIGAVGAAFIGEIGALLAAHPETDLIVVNPFASYFGGDVSRNAELSEFLRTGLDPLIKPDRAGVLFVHHTNKPPAVKERGGWGTDAFAAYVGAGGAEIVNWSRAMLAVMPTEAAGVFQLTAGKRGQRLGWTDAAGEKTTKQYIAHSEGRIFWREATPEEAEAVDGGKREKADPAKDAEQLADALRKQAASFTDAREIASQLFPRTRARRAYDAVKDSPATYRLSTCRAAKKGCMFIGTQPEAEALARAYDAETGGKAENEAVLPT